MEDKGVGMSKVDRLKLFDLRCKSRSGRVLSSEEQAFCKRMYYEFTEEYLQDTVAVFNKTASELGSSTRLGDGRTEPDLGGTG